MESANGNKPKIIHYWSDARFDSVDFTIAQSKLFSDFHEYSIALSPSDIKKGHSVYQSVVLRQFMNEFPAGTIHICNLSFIAIQTKRYIIAKYNNQIFLGPDNGFFYLAFPQDQVSYFIIPTQGIPLPIKALTDIYIPTVKKILHENLFDLIESTYEPKVHMVKPLALNPTIAGNVIRLTCMYIDHSGNAFFNIDKTEFNELCNGRKFRIRTLFETFDRISTDYDDVPEGQILCLFGNGDIFQIAQNAGNVAHALAIEPNSQIIVEFLD
jgi:S-adenosylmethionine hydrolase